MIIDNLNSCILFTLSLISMSVLISSLEYIVGKRVLLNSGFVDWEVIRLRHRITTKPSFVSSLTDWLFLHQNFSRINFIRAIICLSLIFYPIFGDSLTIVKLLVIPLTILTILVSLRMPYGQDGADQMALVILGSFSLCSFSSTFNMHYFIYFIAFQGIISYFFAGLAKGCSRIWWSGQALLDIFSLNIYGHFPIYSFLKARPNICQLMSWFIIIFEVCSIFLPFFPLPLAIVYVISIILFHLFNAFFLGLNTFFWSFLAVHPSILFTCRSLHA